MTTSTTSADLPRHTTLPMVLTITRIVLGPVIAGLILAAATFLYTDGRLAGQIYTVALIVFLCAAATDWLDGYYARKLNAVTPLGAALDHCADKVLIACTLLALAYAALPLNLVAATAIILGRDIAVAGLREGLANSGRAIPVGTIGKWKAAAEMAGVAAFLAQQSTPMLNLLYAVLQSGTVVINAVTGLQYAAEILLWAGAALALISAAQYVSAAIKPAPKTN